MLSHKMQKAFDSNEYGNDILKSSYLSQLLIMTNLSFQDDKRATLEEHQNIMPKFLADTMQFIDTHILDNITLKMLSEHVYLNGTYLSRQFKEYTGITVQKYIINKKVSLAARYLAAGESVTTACYMSGFGNYANFIRTFTKQMGISPGKYRNTI
jgi:AraC-like DNA-binding protein